MITILAPNDQTDAVIAFFLPTNKTFEGIILFTSCMKISSKGVVNSFFIKFSFKLIYK